MCGNYTAARTTPTLTVLLAGAGGWGSFYVHAHDDTNGSRYSVEI